MVQVLAGVMLAGAGAAMLAGLLPALGDYAYPIVWWGVLLLVDAWNSMRSGLSMWRARPGHFVGIILPASVVIWLLFEALNLAAPQWAYRGGIPGIWPKVLFGFAAFSTVIPVVVEAWWLVAGRQCFPAAWSESVRGYWWMALTAAAVFTAVPFLGGPFWVNQGMWLIPGVALLPFARLPACSPAQFVRAVVFSGLLAGLSWEALNLPARTHWEYLILADFPHLFRMPAPGYLGFIPFAFSMAVLHDSLARVKPGFANVVALYGIAVGGLYWLTTAYVEAGIWRAM